VDVACTIWRNGRRERHHGSFGLMDERWGGGMLACGGRRAAGRAAGRWRARVSGLAAGGGGRGIVLAVSGRSGALCQDVSGDQQAEQED
jgi:hypothetical protein